MILEGRDPGANSWPRSTVRGRRCGGPGPARLSGETSTARLEGALPPTGHHLVARPRRGDQYSAAHTARDGVALPVTHPFAPVGDGGPLAQLVGDRDPAPPVETALPAASPAAAGGRSSLLCPPSAWSPRPLWTALKDGCVARPPGRGARVMMRPSIRARGSRCRFPYQPGHQLQAPGIGQQGQAPPRPAPALVVGDARVL